MLLLLRWPCLLQDVLSTDVYCSNKPAAVAPKETITHHFFVSELGRRNCRCKFVAAENVVKTETQQTFVNGIARFYLGIYTPLGSACIAHTCMSCPSIWATLSALLIYLGSFQLFLHSDQPLEGEITVQRCLPVGEADYPRRRWWLHALTDNRLL